MTGRPAPTYRQALATCACTVLTALTCAALMAAAALVPAPPAALPLLIAVSIGCPMLAVSQSSSALAVLRGRRRADRLDERALIELRRELDQLPETGHPLDR
jgi:hypothetical protein